jgi:large subunit ribosomal protein L21
MDVAVGEQLNFDRVLLYRKDDSEVLVGRPFVAGVAVAAEIVSHTKGPKLIVFRFKRRKRVRVKNGHRQPHTVVRFKDFVLT